MKRDQRDYAREALVAAKFEMCMNVDALAKEIGVTRQTVYDIAKRLGLTRKLDRRLANIVRIEESRDYSAIVASAIESRTPLEKVWR